MISSALVFCFFLFGSFQAMPRQNAAKSAASIIFSLLYFAIKTSPAKSARAAPKIGKVRQAAITSPTPIMFVKNLTWLPPKTEFHHPP
jgi:hypothetical protein